MRQAFSILGVPVHTWLSSHDRSDNRFFVTVGDRDADAVRMQVQYGVNKHSAFRASVNLRDEDIVSVGGSFWRCSLYFLLHECPGLSHAREAKTYSLSVDHETVSVNWKINADPNSWTSKTPKWQDGSWYPLGMNMRRGELTVIESRPVIITMPERAYRGVATLSHGQAGFQKLPAWLDRKFRTVEIVMDDGEAVPTPGKGENSWDCGEDATYSSSGPYESIDEAVIAFEKSTLARRQRYGGKNWVPEMYRAADRESQGGSHV